MGFAGFSGTINLGSLDAGKAVQFNYVLQAHVTGIGTANVGIASINDPFFIDGDPVRGGAAVTFASTPAAASAPEPWTAALLAIALTALAVRRRDRRRSVSPGRR